MNSLSKFPNPRKDLTSFVVVGVGHSSMPSSFVWFACSWFSGLSNPMYLVLVTQEVYSSGSGNILSILAWDVVRILHRLENITIGSNNLRFVLVISHL